MGVAETIEGNLKQDDFMTLKAKGANIQIFNTLGNHGISHHGHPNISQ